MWGYKDTPGGLAQSPRTGFLYDALAVLRRRRRAALALCLLVGAMAWFQPWLPRVPLLTGDDPLHIACLTSGRHGVLAADSEYGTRLDSEPVKWPFGFTARRVGSEVQVLGWLGNVVATTGGAYYLPGGPAYACGDAITQ